MAKWYTIMTLHPPKLTKPKKTIQDITPVIGKVGTHKLWNWHGYTILTGNGKSAFILDEIQYRRKNVKQNMIIVVGSPGEGKSYFALRLAEILDPKFNPNRQIVFDRTHLLWLIGAQSPLRMGQVIIIDEAQFIAGARRWYEDIQKDVMEHIEAIRSKGFVILIVALHINLLDKVIRKYVLSQMMKMKERGSAIVYRLWTPTFQDKLYRKRVGSMILQIPSFEQCKYPSCLLCRYNNKCQTNRAIYERNKKAFLNRMSKISQQKAAKREQQSKFTDYNDAIEKIAEQKDMLIYTKNGNPEPESIRIILEEKYGMLLSNAEAKRLIKRGQIKKPEIFKKEDGE